MVTWESPRRCDRIFRWLRPSEWRPPFPPTLWTSKAAIAKLSPESREGFWHLCPAFVIELRSKSDRLRTLPDKMQEYVVNGAQLGWLIDPETRTVDIYRPGQEPESVANVVAVTGEGPLEGFTLDLRTVWDPLTA